jgi:transposase
MLRLPTLQQLDASSAVRIFLCAEATDMRRSFDRLAEMVRESLEQDPFSGHLFVFRSRVGDKLKIFYWDSDGFAQWYKRLEEGTFRFPRVAEGQRSVEVKASELAMLLEGIDLRSIKRGRRFAYPAQTQQKS